MNNNYHLPFILAFRHQIYSPLLNCKRDSYQTLLIDHDGVILDTSPDCISPFDLSDYVKRVHGGKQYTITNDTQHPVPQPVLNELERALEGDEEWD